MAKEWVRFNVQANAVAYGWVETRLTASKEDAGELSRDGDKVALGILSTQGEMLKIVIPMGRGGTPDKAAGVILFLASPLSNYVSGQVIEMTGGM